MRLTDRDIQIIEFITENKGATIEQIYKMCFPSYDSAANRLKILSDNKFLNTGIHPVLGKKVYFIKKLPSYHSLIINDVAIVLKGKYKSIKREYKLKKYKIDCIFILNEGKLLIVEIDLFNKTSDKKLNDIMIILAESKIEFEIWIICKYERRSKIKKIKYMKIEDIKNKLPSQTLI